MSGSGERGANELSCEMQIYSTHIHICNLQHINQPKSMLTGGYVPSVRAKLTQLIGEKV